MQTIRHPNDVRFLRDETIQQLVAERFAMLAEYGPYVPETHGWFLIVEPGDDPAQPESLPCPALLGDDDRIRFGEEGYFSPFEFCEFHDGKVFELVRVISDAGEAVAIFIPDLPGVSPDLLCLCRTLAANS